MVASTEAQVPRMRFDLVTIFPELFTSTLEFGVLRRAREEHLVHVSAIDLRQFTHDRHRTVDDRPYGGGEGMVMKPEPIFAAVESLGVAEKSIRDRCRERVLLLSPQGRPFTQTLAAELATLDRLVLICGRYEGVDERVSSLLCDGELSIGDYVLSGGELAAAVVVDTVVRLIPGVLGNPDSARFESFGAADDGAETKLDGVPRSTHGSGGLLDYPHYTRPQSFRGEAVPSALGSGDHDAIRRWRRRMSLKKTLLQRPELLDTAPLTQDDERVLAELRLEHTDLLRQIRSNLLLLSCKLIN